MIEFPSLPDEEPTDDEGSSIQFYVEDVEYPLTDEDAVASWLMDSAENEGQDIHEISFIFCSDEYLLEVNQEYLDHDYYTDVITFQLTEGALHGDIFISTDRVADNATTLKVSFEQELRRVMVHGLLHLAGYGDKTPEDETAMRAKEDFYLAKWVG
jgi:probable rRNA maturation factor